MTWNELISNYIASKKDMLSEATINDYRVRLYNFVKYLYKDDKKDEVLKKDFENYTRQDVKGYLNTLKELGKSISVYNKAYSALLSFGEYLNTLDKKTPDLDGLRDKGKENRETRFEPFHKDVIYDVANSGNALENACIRINFEGAVKRDDLCNVRVHDFDLEKNQLIIYQKDSNRIKKICILTDETIVIIKQAIKDMTKMVDTINANKIQRNEKPDRRADYLFQSRKFDRPSYTAIHNLIKRAAKKYCEKENFTDERTKEFVSRFHNQAILASKRVYLLSKTTDIKKVMMLMGENNYHSVKSYQIYVPMIYPESVSIE